MKAVQYAEALHLASSGKDDATCARLVQNLVQLLEASGHSSLLPAILRELDKLTRTRQSADACTVSVARAQDMETRRGQIDADMKELGASTLPVHTVVDETLAGGHVVTALGKQIDRTHKSKLLSLYSTLITNS